MELIAYALSVDEAGTVGAQLEWFRAREVGRGLFRLLESPVFGRGFARGDVVRAVRDRGAYWVESVVETPGHWCARVVPNSSRQVTDEMVLAILRDAALEARTTDFPMIVVDVPTTRDHGPVIELLESRQADGTWYYDLAVDPCAQAQGTD